MFTKAHLPLTLLASIATAAAQDFLDPLVITATRSSSALGDVPYSGTYFSSEDFRENTVRTLPDALRYTPGVLVQKTAHGHGSPFIRGFTGRQNLFLIDGIRFNNSTFRGGPVQYWNTVDPFSLDHFELIRSQGSVLYGSDAAGGTLNAFTKSSGFADEADGQLFSHGSAYYEYRSNGQGSHIGRLETQTGIGGKFGLHLGISAKEFGDIEDSAVGLMRGTGYPEQAYDARFDWAISPQTTLTAVHQDLEQDAVSRWHSTISNPGWTHGNHKTDPGKFLARDFDQDRSLNYIRLAHVDDSASAPVRRITATLSYQESSERELQNRTLVPVDRRLQYYEVDTLGFDLELESPLADGSLVYGLDYYRDSVDSTASSDTGAGFVFNNKNRPVGDDSTYELFGAYAQYIRPIGESFEITAGLRYTNAKADIGTFFNPAVGADISTEDSWNDLSASLRATYKIDDHKILYGGISQAFRSPNLNDLTGNLTSGSGVPVSGALDLEPENFITTELGYRQESDKSGMALAVFYTDISDQIAAIRAIPGGPRINRNSGDGHIYGVEFEGFWKFAPQWTLSGFASWQESQIERLAFVGGPTVQEPLSRVMPLNGSIALRWDHSSAPFWVEGRVLASATADRLAESDIADPERFPTNGTPSYAVASIHAGWNPSENIQITAGVENLLDDDYRNHGSGQNEPGTNAILGMKYLW